MPLTFAILLFFIAGLAESLRQDLIAVDRLAGLSIIGAAATLAALVILRRDAVRVIRPPVSRQDGDRAFAWSWPRTAAALCVVPFLALITMTFGAIFTSYYVHIPHGTALIWGLGVQTIVVALPQELFFREAVLKIFGPGLGVAFAITAGAVALFHLPNGLPAAAMAAGAALAYMALRVVGMNILVVALVHGAANVLFGRVLVPELAGTQALWGYTVAFFAAHALFALAVLALAQPARRLVLERA